MKKPQFIIAAPTSNSGKTTLTLGLLKAFKNRGLSVQSFKCGPDYIDTQFHSLACGKQGINLDLFMMSKDDIKETYATYSAHSDISCIEGVMGLFDGAVKAKESTAQLAKFLQLPVILIVNAKSVAYSVAPLLYGFKNFDQDLQIAGVIFNQVNSASHYRYLEEACLDVGIPSLGYFPFLASCEIPSRHLGLSTDNIQCYSSVVEQLGQAVEKHLHVDLLLKLCNKPVVASSQKQSPSPASHYTIAIAQDKAFDFCYAQNIEALRRRGKVLFFSPLKDTSLPAADLIYLPGGYPECYLAALSENQSMLSSIQQYVSSGGYLIAECGGMMYLGKSMLNEQGQEFPMVNIFDFSTSMTNMKLSLGYRKIQIDNVELRGHEFHYSSLINGQSSFCEAKIFNARTQTVNTKIYKYKNVMASYIHLYFGTDTLLNQLLSIFQKKHP